MNLREIAAVPLVIKVLILVHSIFEEGKLTLSEKVTIILTHQHITSDFVAHGYDYITCLLAYLYGNEHKKHILLAIF
jgi:hypothetical protein